MYKFGSVTICSQNRIFTQENARYYKDRKCTVNENSLARIVASVHYNARDLIVKVVPQTGYC